ncbi:hypothetical protein ES703_62133 [subsurface metagenome]
MTRHGCRGLRSVPKPNPPFEHPPLPDIIGTIAGGKPGGEGLGGGGGAARGVREGRRVGDP